MRDNSTQEMKRSLKAFFALLLLLGLISLGTWVRTRSQTKQTDSNQISVVTTFYPLAEFAQQVGGDRVSVKNLTPAGTEPHDFEPTPQDMVAIQTAQLFIYNGAGFELWLNKVDEAQMPTVKRVNASQDLTLRMLDKSSQTDPHIWLDPVLASKEVETIAQALITTDPAHEQEYRQRATKYQQQLAILDEEFKRGVSNCVRHEIVTSHNAFGYLAQRYGITVLPISGLSPDEEPSPKKMSEVADFVKTHKVKYIFFESLVSPKLAETIAHETGAQTIAFNPLEGLTDQELAEGQNYLSVQRQNITALRTALECK